MKHIFYFLAIFPIIWEATNLIDVQRTHNFLRRFKKMKGKELDEYTTNQKSFMVCVCGYLIWNFIGLFSFQWIMFLGLFLLGFIPKKYAWYRWIDSFISLTILIFIVLNEYHFKIDIWNLLLSKY